MSTWITCEISLLHDSLIHVLLSITGFKVIQFSGTSFSGGLAVQISPSNAQGVGLIPSKGVNIPHASGPKNKNIKKKKNIVINSIKT